MSRFFTEKYSRLIPYTPGEQPKDMKYIKLNTNESPFPPSESVVKAAAEEAGKLQLYSDPVCTALTEKLAEIHGVDFDEVLATSRLEKVDWKLLSLEISLELKILDFSGNTEDSLAS